MDYKKYYKPIEESILQEQIKNYIYSTLRNHFKRTQNCFRYMLLIIEIILCIIQLFIIQNPIIKLMCAGVIWSITICIIVYDILSDKKWNKICDELVEVFKGLDTLVDVSKINCLIGFCTYIKNKKE